MSVVRVSGFMRVWARSGGRMQCVTCGFVLLDWSVCLFMCI